MQQLPLDRWAHPGYISDIAKDTETLHAMGLLSNCHPDIIQEALRLRQNLEEIYPSGDSETSFNDGYFQGGYHSFTIPKKGGRRVIHEPADALKTVQAGIKDALLSQVQTYAGALGGETGKSFIENARLHARNQPRYLINMDLKNAYPSVKAERVFVNLRGALRKKLELSYPEWSESQKERLVDMIVILTTHNDEIPQGASTSMKLLNMVMAASDREISQFLHTSEAGLSSPLYTRYVDDLSVSWKEFQDMHEVWRKRGKILRSIKKIQEHHSKGELGSDAIAGYIAELGALFGELKNTPFEFNARRQRAVLIELISQIQDFLSQMLFFAQNASQESLQEGIKNLQTEIAGYRHHIEQEKEIGNVTYAVQQQLQKILTKQGWTTNTGKTRIWTPSSKAQKVVTGVSIDSRGNLGIPQQKEAEMLEFLNRALSYPTTLPHKYQGNPLLLAQTILGYRNYVTQVRGGLNGELKKIFGALKDMYFPYGSDTAEKLGYGTQAQGYSGIK